MGLILYFIGTQCYYLLIRLAALFNTKAASMIQGRNGIFSALQKALADNTAPVLWFHCASLGEFEQGRPVMEDLKLKHPGYKILLTFFSPSGFEVRKNYSGADWVFYLPFDSYGNAKRFLKITKPELAFFVKYEFWHYYIQELWRQKIPVFLISALFRKDQIFFQWYGGFFRNILKKFQHIFLQNSESEILLKNIDITSISLAGDTRYDRVHAQLSMATTLPLIEAFRKDDSLVIIGSAWDEDMRLMIPLMNNRFPSIRYIVAPHELHAEEIERWRAEILFPSELYSEVVQNGMVQETTRVLIIDSIGLLASIYRYGHYAHVGGAFGKGLHNILEAATFGMPISFGPNIQKFPEAKAMIEEKAALSVKSYEQLYNYFRVSLVSGNNERKAELARNFVQKNRGATSKIMSYISPLLKRQI